MRRTVTYLGIVLFILAKLSTTVSAEPVASVVSVNDKTKECTIFSMGDECVTCNVPESLKVSTQNNCPSGYKQIHKKADCTPNKDSFCCSFLHSGMMGDCEDVVINNINKECAFVLDINECIKLPDDWHRAEEKETWGRVCPSLEYTWKDEFLACSTKSILPQWIKLFGLLTFLIVIFLGATRFKKFRNK